MPCALFRAVIGCIFEVIGDPGLRQWWSAWGQRPRGCRPRLNQVSYKHHNDGIQVYYVPVDKLESRRFRFTAGIFAPLANWRCWLQDVV